MKDGPKLRAYLNQKRINKTALAKKLGMSKQNLYQFFDSDSLGEGTKKRLENQLKVKWDVIDAVNIDVTPDVEMAEPPKENETLLAISRTAEMLAADKERTTALIERMFNFIEKQFNYSQAWKVGEVPLAQNTPTAEHPFENAGLGNSIYSAKKGSRK